MTTTKAASQRKRRRTTMVPVITMEEIPVLAEEERAALLASLKESEARIKAGDYCDYDGKEFKDRLLGIHRAAER